MARIKDYEDSGSMAFMASRARDTHIAVAVFCIKYYADAVCIRYPLLNLKIIDCHWNMGL